MILAAAGLLSISSAGHAQTETNKHPVIRPGAGTGAARGIEARLKELTTRLNLTEEEKPKVKAILEEQEKKRAELRGAGALSPEERRAKAQAFAEETAKKLKEVLTPEQFTKYEDLTKQRVRRAVGVRSEGTNKPAAGEKK